MIATDELPAPALAPWQAEPYRLWSLLDMLKFYASPFIEWYQAASTAMNCVAFAVAANRPTERAASEKSLRTALGHLREECLRLPLSAGTIANITRISEIAIEPTTSPAALALTGMARVQEMFHTIQADLGSHAFYCVPSDKRHMMDDSRAPFGAEVNERFGELASRDSFASARCLALDEWTASVFHSVRVFDHGLRALAEIFEVPYDRQQWRTILDGIEKGIRAIEAEAPSKEKAEWLGACSVAATQLRYVKDAWRNHVMHARTSYDSREAQSVHDHTGEFMRALVEILRFPQAEQVAKALDTPDGAR